MTLNSQKKKQRQTEKSFFFCFKLSEFKPVIPTLLNDLIQNLFIYAFYYPINI